VRKSKGVLDFKVFSLFERLYDNFKLKSGKTSSGDSDDLELDIIWGRVGHSNYSSISSVIVIV